MINLNNIRVIAFDADDTLWDCQSHFETVENHLYRLIAPYCEAPAKELFQTESGNMADLGYGCKAFTISIIETALLVAGDHLSATELADLLHAADWLNISLTWKSHLTRPRWSSNNSVSTSTSCPPNC